MIQMSKPFRKKRLVEHLKKKSTKRLLFGVIILMTAILFYFTESRKVEVEEVAFSEFRSAIVEGDVKQVTLDMEHEFLSYTDQDDKLYQAPNPKSENFKRELLEMDVDVVEEQSSSTSFIDIISILSTIMLIGVMALYVKKVTGTAPVSLSKTIPNIKFKDIAGNQEAKDEMKVVVDFLKNGEKYKGKGARLPKGVIFYGAPGTGKTLMARAVAGEAGVPFLSISGADFSELYVGSGARKVRALFEEARKNSPSIIFIDEVDAVGSSRSEGQNNEYKQTINALLSELDGFTKDEDVVVIAATNRMEDLDTALIRPGRFDKHVAIALPDKEDRMKILKLHMEDKEVDDSVNLEQWAKMTVGMAGADIASFVNEAIILSVTDGRSAISNQDLDDAHYKIVMKGHKKENPKNRNQNELELVAWHEAGHALLAKKVANQSVPKVSILSSTSGAGGVTFITPNDNSLPSKREVEARIITLYGGRIAEHLLLNDQRAITSGASHDIKEATRLIRLMLTEWGMTEGYGMINPDILFGKHEASAYLLEEAKDLSSNLYEQAHSILSSHMKELEDIANTLLEKESINEEELDAILNRKVVA